MNRGGAGKGKEKEQGTGNREQGAGNSGDAERFFFGIPCFLYPSGGSVWCVRENPYLWKNRIYKLQKTTIMKRFYLLTALFALTAAGCVKVDLVDAISSPPLKI